ncbi:MAG: WbqC family protein [Desulfobulbaceae bacterium]|nr:WbqC family protein [Desulfobulbaceae bacterium]
MKLSIHQPQYWPWPPYLHKILSADLFIYLDTVQFSKNGLQNRNQIKTANGACWLTLPVQQKLGQKICETQIANSNILKKHAKSIVASYAKTPGFRLWKEELEQCMSVSEGSTLSDITITITEWMLKKLGARNKRVRMSSLPEIDGQKGELILNICRHFQADDYLTGKGSLAYMDINAFQEINCNVLVQECTPIHYQQAFPKQDFIPDLSALDLLMSCPDEARELILTHCKWRKAC